MKITIDSNDGLFDYSQQEQIFRRKTGVDYIKFYHKYLPKLIFYLHGICKDKQTSEDVCQESFLTALEKIDTYDNQQSQPSTWLFTIARNKMLQLLDKKNILVSIDSPIDDEGSSVKDFISDDTDPEYEEYLCKREEKGRVLMKNINSLSDQYKKVIEMCDIKEMQYKDIAAELNLNLNTCKSQIRNGRLSLIKKSKKEFDNIDRDKNDFHRIFGKPGTEAPVEDTNEPKMSRTTAQTFKMLKNNNTPSMNKEYIEQKNINSTLVSQKLGMLKEPYQQVLRMREIDNLSYHEISNRLNIKLGDVKTKISRGRSMIIKMIEKDS